MLGSNIISISHKPSHALGDAVDEAIKEESSSNQRRICLLIRGKLSSHKEGEASQGLVCAIYTVSGTLRLWVVMFMSRLTFLPLFTTRLVPVMSGQISEKARDMESV
jgi:hypothetical protein